jgi:hypothetical protein
MALEGAQATRGTGWIFIVLVPALALVAGYASGHDHDAVAHVLWALFVAALLGSWLLPGVRAFEHRTRRNIETVALAVAGPIVAAVGLMNRGDAYDSTVFGLFLLIPVGVVMWLCGCLRRPE